MTKPAVEVVGSTDLATMGSVVHPRNRAMVPSGPRAVAERDLPVPVRGDVIEAYEAMIANVPEATGDGVERILEQIAAAERPEDLDRPWRTDGLAEFADQPLMVRSIRKLPSDFEGGLPWFLVVEAATVATGDLITLTTGAVSVVAQLVRAWSLGAFPLVVIPRRSPRPSRAGYFAWHLEMERR